MHQSHPHLLHGAHTHEGAAFPPTGPLEDREPAPGHTGGDGADVGGWESPWIDLGGEG